MSPEHSSISSSKRRTRILHILRFSGVVIVLALLFQYVFERKIILDSQSSGSYKINRILHPTNENEIPIFGPSTAEGALIPSLLGPDFFNYGLAGVKDDVLLFFLEQECKKVKRNPNILMVFTLDGFTYGIGYPSNYILNSTNPDVKKLIGDNYKFYYSIPFIKYYGQYESYFKEYLNQRMMLTKYMERGASIEKDVLTKESFDLLIEKRKNTPTWFKNDSVLEKRFVDLVQSNPNRHFIILIPPFHPSYFYQYKNYEDALHFLSWLSTFPNISVLNYSHHFYSDDCYFNTTHLNYKGAVLFNEMLRDTLIKIITGAGVGSGVTGAFPGVAGTGPGAGLGVVRAGLAGTGSGGCEVGWLWGFGFGLRSN
jgi:hypothetical protein